MNANGLVLAASMTSQTLTPNRSHNNAISLMKLMLMKRKVFSTSLASSAISGELTGTTSSMHAAYRRQPSRVDSGPLPPTILGVFLTV